MNKNYVYQLIDPRNNEVFYVGEGKGNRAWTHQRFQSGCVNPHKDRIIQKIHEANLEVIVVISHEGLSKQQSRLVEEQIINEIGLKNLSNITANANPPINCGSSNGFFGKTHSEETRKKCGDANRGKNTKTEYGLQSISQSMINRWQDPVRRENQINALKSRKGEKRSAQAIESYKKAAADRNSKMTPEQRSARTLAGCTTKKLRYAGLKRQRYVDETGKIRFRWIPSSD